MRFSFHFHDLEWSNALIENVKARFEKLAHFELKPLSARITFSSERHEHWVSAVVQGPNGTFTAKFGGPSFQDSLDRVVEKLTRQLSRKKGKVQRHKNWSQSHLGKLSRLNGQLEPQPRSRSKRAS